MKLGALFLVALYTTGCGHKPKTDANVASAINSFFTEITNEQVAAVCPTGSTLNDPPLNLSAANPLSAGRISPAAVGNGTKAFFTGGSTSSGSAVGGVDIYDSANQTWSTALLSATRSGLAAASAGHFVLFAGGQDFGSTVDIFNATKNTWSTASLAVPRYALAGGGDSLKAVFAGGYARLETTNTVSYPPSAAVDIFDVATSTWSTAALSTARSSMNAVAAGGKILFAGGFDAKGAPSDTVDIYDTKTGSWTTSTMPHARAQGAGTAIGSLALFAGGVASMDGLLKHPVTPATAAPLVVDIYDTVQGTWSSVTAPPSQSALSFLSAAGDNSGSGTKALFAGGACLNAAGSINYSNAVNVFDTATKQWTALAFLSQGRAKMGAATAGNQLLFGGGTTKTAAAAQIDLFTTTALP